MTKAQRMSRKKAAEPPQPKRKLQGFAAMDPKKRSAIASLGGHAAHDKGVAHEWTSEEAKSAGRKGGQISRGGRGRLPVDGGEDE